ncbi:protein rep [Pseudonocardia acidicola]|uniref:protein rep n=1 Tax=Pseudonocardia acidicola TaxID=2724939 RepID=UPI001EEFA0FC|nr:protein rep [Pseudonocardia acidicola]
MVEAAVAQGGGGGLISLTLRHNRGHRLADSWDALRYAWSRVVSGKAYQRERERFGIEGWCCAVEVTRSQLHGWHPHAHVLVITDIPLSAEMLAELGGRWFARWERALARRGYTALEHSGGLDARVISIGSGDALAGYLTKVSLEAAGQVNKDGRRGSRSPFQILRDGLATGLADDLEAWFEYEQASQGRKQLTWSRGLRARYRLAPEQSDEAIAAEDMGGDDLLALPAETWRAVRDRAEVLLGLAEQAGLLGVMAWLAYRGLAWHAVEGPPGRAPTIPAD